MNYTSLDIFCHVIDNFGDAGVAWRLARALQALPNHGTIRLFIDSLNTLHAIVPKLSVTQFIQSVAEVTIIDASKLNADHLPSLGTADIVIEAFACEIPECYYKEALFSSRLIINIDYLSAETWVEGYHLQESLLPSGTAKKYFFMPGFTSATGGLLQSPEVMHFRTQSSSAQREYLSSLLAKAGYTTPLHPEALVCSVFSYLRSFDTFLSDASTLTHPLLIICFGAKTKESMLQSVARLEPECIPTKDTPRVIPYKNCTILLLPFLPQAEYDALLCSTDFNIVRGEDSLARAVLSGKPFIWNAYLQDAKYHKVKVAALTAMMQRFFDDEQLFSRFAALQEHFNDLAVEQGDHFTTGESFTDFFADLKKIEHSTRKLCYFIEQNCNLVEKLSDFIKKF